MIKKQGVEVVDESTNLGSAKTIKFTGAGVAATLSGSTATVTISGGGGGGGAELSDDSPAAVGTASAGVAETASRSDHVHAHGNQLGGSLHANASAGVSAGFMSAADKTKLDGISASAAALTASAPAQTTKAAAVVGVATDAARADHKHDISTAAASSLTMGGANAEGTATSLARSDHTHALPGYGSPGANSISAAGSDGVATTVARSDHQHAGPGFGSPVAFAAAGSDGVATTVARSDHVHATPATVTVTTLSFGTPNLTGSGSTVVASGPIQSGGGLNIVGGNYLSVTANNQSLMMRGRISDGAGVAANIFETTNPLSNATARIASFRNVSTEKFALHHSGAIYYNVTDTTADTDGTVTCDTPAGYGIVPSGTGVLTVNSSIVTANSIIYVVIVDNTDDLRVRSVVPASGSFTITLGGTMTGNRQVRWVVFKTF